MESKFHKKFRSIDRLTEALLSYYDGIFMDPEDDYCLAGIFEILVTEEEILEDPEVLIATVVSNMERVESIDHRMYSVYKCFIRAIYHLLGKSKQYKYLSETIENETHPAAQIGHVILQYRYIKYHLVREWVLDFLVSTQMQAGFNIDLMLMSGALSHQIKSNERERKVQ